MTVAGRAVMAVSEWTTSGKLGHTATNNGHAEITTSKFRSF